MKSIVSWARRRASKPRFASREGKVVVERDMVSSTGKAFKRKYWVNPKDVKPGDKVVKEGAETTKPDAGKQTPVAHVESRAPSVAQVQGTKRRLSEDRKSTRLNSSHT